MQSNTQIWQANRMASWLFLGAAWIGSCESALAATVTRGPYLQSGTPSGIVVRWRTDATTDSEVRYGAAPGSLTFRANSSTVTTEHEITLKGLTPDTQYYYSVGTTATIQSRVVAAKSLRSQLAIGALVARSVSYDSRQMK